MMVQYPKLLIGNPKAAIRGMVCQADELLVPWDEGLGFRVSGLRVSGLGVER